MSNMSKRTYDLNDIELETQIKNLKDYIDSEKKDFDFLIESFSPTYFYELCKKNT